MTRIAKHLLVQRVDDQLVLMDQSAGAEIVYDPEQRARLLEATRRLFPEDQASWGQRFDDLMSGLPPAVYVEAEDEVAR